MIFLWNHWVSFKQESKEKSFGDIDIYILISMSYVQYSYSTAKNEQTGILKFHSFQPEIELTPIQLSSSSHS